LVDAPETINSEPYASGWMVKIKLNGEADASGLMDATAYETYCQDR
jgi:glycine cleavage system H protein